MKVLHLSKSDSTGGAGIAAFRLHRALCDHGVNSEILCLDQHRNDSAIHGPRTPAEKAFAAFRGVIDRFPIYGYRRRTTAMFYPQWLPSDILRRIRQIAPDIVHLHWICGGFVRLENLAAIGRPLVWTLHDMWPFTGGCHYSGDCDRYRSQCGNCPQLGSGREYDLSRWTWNRKHRVFPELNMAVVSPSRWLAGCADESSLLADRSAEIIPYTIDLERFSPAHRGQARKILNLPRHKKIILLGADQLLQDNRKGYSLADAALKALARNGVSEEVHIAVFGASTPKHHPVDGPFTWQFFGRLHDEVTLSLLYAACDVFLTPTIQDNLPLTVMESLSSGTPVVAFRLGGLPDMVIHKKNGYLSPPMDTHDLGTGLKWVLEDVNRWQRLSIEARRMAEMRFSAQSVTDKYIRTYEALRRH